MARVAYVVIREYGYGRHDYEIVRVCLTEASADAFVATVERGPTDDYDIAEAPIDEPSEDA